VIPLVSVAEMRELEQAAFDSGVSEAALQERAGTAVGEEVARRVAPGQRVVVLVGRGNNGRDGMIAGRFLAQRAVPVELVLAPKHAVTDDELGQLRRLGVRLVDDASSALSTAHVAVDALLGIGATGALREPLASMARAFNASKARKVALDIPSGIDADTGEVPGEAVAADYTVTLGAVKHGLLRFPAAERVGKLIVRDIGLRGEQPSTCLEPEDLTALVPQRPSSAHKYRFGRVLVLAGSDHFLGAPVLCSGGALRAGAGLVTVGSTDRVRSVVAAQLPEATYVQHGANIDDYLESHNALVIGPGLGRGDAVTRYVNEVLTKRADGATVIDADALYALSTLPDWPALVGPRTILTPHAGELQRLLGSEPEEPLWQAAARLAQQWRCVLVAKGPFTCVAAPDGRVSVWPHANSALATGGTGDVLAGLCGGFLAQGCAPVDAARLAVGVHALAAQRIVERRGWRTLLASDLLPEIPAVLHDLV
jgi:ADP-dependent NAD(P)H-hydrate dehydratase / NAD(P)H-hydrate epimerase